MFALTPLVVMPGITIAWIIFGPNSVPWPYLYLAFEPLNVLSSYVILFSSPGNDGNPLLEIVVYIVGGPIVVLGGGIAEMMYIGAKGNGKRSEPQRRRRS